MDITRYLCAGMYLNPGLADWVIRWVVGNSYRALPPQDGFDLATVARHALAARRRHLVRDLCLIVDVFVLLVALAEHSALFVLLLLLGVWLIVAVEAFTSRYGVLARSLSRAGFDPGRAPEPSSAWARERIARISHVRDQNLVVYGEFEPFLGAGGTSGAWSFALDLTRAAEYGPGLSSFTVDELQAYVVDRVRRLGWSEIAIGERLYVSGLDVADHPAVLPDPLRPPLNQVDDALVKATMRDPDGRLRHYTRFRVEGWRGDIALTGNLRLVVRPTSLFVEMSYSLLGPLQPLYYEVDRLLPTPSAREFARISRQSLTGAPKLALAAIPRLFGALAAPVTRERNEARERRAITRNVGFNYGFARSLREVAGDSNYHRYFQKLDKTMFDRVLDNRVLDALVEFLDQHGVDTRSLVDQATTIVNSGVFVGPGGTLNAGAVAAGQNATANAAQRVRRAAANARGN